MRKAAGVQLDTEAAEALAIRALAFVAADVVLLPRFLALTGLDPSQLRRAAAEPGFLPGVLDFLLAHGPTLAEFCEAEDVPPQRVEAARETLAGPEREFE
ncbi:DUF3572 family protein [Jiella endophytica]|uniref:DUF3572 family protein n=1 Tax=Jiella endophytica TaxID=2558362 RepID=A0A4Y8RTR1_9HYPH|nr:DUF3572 domain-containing protein [Jiella endophytica]TFF27373.1 DUF3572 family protein [Jiella endophytica]